MDIEKLYQQGFQLRCEGQYREASEIFNRVLSMQAGHRGARHQLALIKGFEGDFDGSLEDLAALTTQHPSDLELRYDLAMTQLMLGMVDEGCANLKQILAVNPAHEKALQQSVYC